MTEPETIVAAGDSVNALPVGHAEAAGRSDEMPMVETVPENPTIESVFPAQATSTELTVTLEMVNRVDAV